MSEAVSTFEESNAPPEVSAIFSNAYDTGVKAGMSDADANALAHRVVQHAGYYMTMQGWKRIAPDVRGKVQIRQAEAQPDGTFIVRNVPVFYPNAVKKKTENGEETTESFDPERIRRLIKNTNDAIAAGAAVPSITDQHPHPLNKVGAVTPKPMGRAINWRETPNIGEGWTACDMVKVDPECIDDWRKGQYPGLSAGLANDAQGLNERFGHVALLGVESPALSMLPSTEVFSAPDQLCFATDSSAYSKGPHMAMAKDCYSAFASACKQFSAAFDSMSAKEPTGEEKVKQSFAAMKKCFDAVSPEAPLSMMDNPAGINPATPSAASMPAATPKQEEGEGSYAAEGGFHETQLPAEPMLTGPGTDPGSSIEVAGGPISAAKGQAFAAVPGQLDDADAETRTAAMTRMRKADEGKPTYAFSAESENARLKARLANLEKAYTTSMREKFISDIDSELKGYAAAGINFDASSAREQAISIADLQIPLATKTTLLGNWRKTLQSIPKTTAGSLSDMPLVFGANSDSPVSETQQSNEYAQLGALLANKGINFDSSPTGYGQIGASVFRDLAKA